MRLDELDSWVESQESDTAKRRALEAFFQENPNLREESITNLQALERNSTRLAPRVVSNGRTLKWRQDIENAGGSKRHIEPENPGLASLVGPAGFEPATKRL